MIEKSSSCDFSGLVAGTSGYLQARFVFSEEWSGFSKVVGFFSKDGVEFPPAVLRKDNTCCIPSEALAHHEFNIVVYGKNRGVLITTRPVTIKQHGGIQ